MRILVIAPKDIRLKHIAEGILEEVKNFCVGSKIEFFTVANFYSACSYFEKKITKLGIKNFEKNYIEKLQADLELICKNFIPDFILILDGANIPIPIQKFLSQYKIILWLWDSLQPSSELQNFVTFAEKVFCFEYDDLKYLREKYNIAAHYLPLGVNEKIYYPAECKKDIDISFVGNASKLRVGILEKVCGLAIKKNLKMKIGGTYYDEKYFWKKKFFERRRPNITKFLENRYFNPSEVADLYRRSKICLNINTVEHKSLSPRTFEICATNSFQLMNSGQISHGLLNLETDLATFDGAEDLIAKVEFYLANDELREKIALAGYNSAMKNCTMKKSVEKLFAESEILRGLK